VRLAAVPPVASPAPITSATLFGFVAIGCRPFVN
jgi:hypothetical protein